MKGASGHIPPPETTTISVGGRTYREALEKPRVLEVPREPIRLGGAGLLGSSGASFMACEQSRKGGGRNVVAPKKVTL